MANANKAALQMASIVNGVTDVMAVMKNRIMELEAEVKALKEEKK
jgi:glycerol-3-phosphate responsive antiterminator